MSLKLKSNSRLSLYLLLVLSVVCVSVEVWHGVGIGQTGSQTAGAESVRGEAALKLLKDRGEYASLQRAMETARYRAQAAPESPREYAALNPAQELHSRFTPQGIEVRRHSDEKKPRLAMTLRSVGYDQRQFPVGPGTVTAEEQRVEIHRRINNESAITEWYVNRPNGLEQGFTLAEPPGERRASESLRLTLELSGEWQARLSKDGQAVEFREAGGGTVRYDHLVVRDAAGKMLPARMSLHKDELRLEVEDAGAQWPVTIDPTLAQQAYLKPSNTKQGIFFGRAVAISGETVVVAGHGEPSNATGVNGDQNDNSASFAGGAYVFVRNGSAWSQQAYLKASNTGAEDQFGWFAAISGDTIVIGAPSEDSNATGINGDGNNNLANNSGAAYIYVRNGTTWSQQAYLKASNTDAGDSFGRSVGISGDTVVVGALGEDSNATGVNGNQADNSVSQSGAVYVFVRNGTTWSQQAYLKASNAGDGDSFGQAVAIQGDTLIVGAYGEAGNATGINGNQNDNSASQAGAAYVFVRNGTTWSQQAYLKASNTETGDQFGYSTAISGDTVVIGAQAEDSNATGINGNQGNNLAGFSGAAYVFVRNGVTWSQQAYLKASNTETNDVFGYAVGISGDTIVVSAVLEDSSATGVNGDQSNNSTPLAGAAYVFTRSGTTWSQQSYLKASNPGGDDDFGESVAISGDTIIVGALAEDSNGTGINGVQNNNLARDSGAVYVFATAAPPTITPGGPLTRIQGTTLSNPANNAVVATVSDGNPGTLTVTQTGGSPGVNALGFVNNSGTVTADVGALCSAAVGANTITLTVTNGTTGLSSSAVLTVNVISHTSPTVTYNNASVVAGNALTVNPATGPTNNINIGFTVQSVTPSPAPATITVNSSTGVVSVPNNVPPGNYTATIRSTDNCALVHDATFTLAVGCVTSLTVNNTGDGADAAPGNGVCETAAGNGVCTLRAAIQEANALTACSPFTINFSVAGTITLTNGDLVINRGLTISGPGAQTLAVSGNNASRIFFISDTPGTTTISGLSLTNGNGNGSFGNDTGGAIYNANGQGTVTLSEMSIYGNSVPTGVGGGVEFSTGAGGIMNVVHCSIYGNAALFGGGGIGHRGIGTLNVVNSTIVDNQAGSNRGGGIGGYINGSRTINVVNSTIAGNRNGGLAVYGGSPTVTVRNSLIAANSDGDVVFQNGPPTFTSGGNNLFGSAIPAATQPTDQVGVNPLLEFDGNGNPKLAFNSGTTQTVALLPGSPAIDAGNDCVLDNSCSSVPLGFNLTTDQRGFNRGTGAHVDIGAFESQGFTLTAASGNNQSTPVGTAFANPLSVTVTSGNNEPVNGGQVTFTAPGSGPSATIAGSPATIISGTAVSGTVTANAVIGGPYNVVASANGATSINFSLTNLNTAPTFTPAAAIDRQQGSPAAASVTVGTASDAQTAAGSLTVTQIAGGTATGIIVTGITNTSGTITAVVAADCTATPGTVRFQVSDGSLTGTGDLQVNVTPNAPPTLSYATASVTAAGSTTVNPATATDNGLITGYSIVSVMPALTTAPTVSNSGVVSITNASPAGSHTITVRATDNCGATTDTQFTLTVTCPTITVTPPATGTVTAGVAFNQSFTQTGGTPPVGFALASGTLPSGITLAASGTLSGTTSQTGSFPITVTVTDANGCTGTSATFTLTVNCQTITVSPASLNSATTGVNFSQQFTATGNLGAITWSLVGTAPPGLSFNAQTAALSGTPTQNGSFPFTMRATDANGCFGEQQYTLGVGCASVTVSPANAALPGGTAGSPYNQSFTAAGGASPYTFTISAGNPPTGLDLNSDGTLSGSPTVFGDFSFTVRATDANGCFGKRQYTLRICGVIALTASLPGGTTGVTYNPSITASGGASPYTFAVSGGNLPPGLNLDGNGTLSGTPNQSGSFTFTVTATDNLGCTGAQSYTVSIGCQTITINQTSLPNGFAGTAYNQSLTAAGGTAPYSFAVSAGALPGGVTLSSGGALSGTPTTQASFSFTIRATDANGCFGEQAFTVLVSGNGLMFYPLPSPVRLLDTRTGFSGCTTGVGALAAGSTRTQAARTACSTIPANATAIIGNITVVPSGPGYLTLFPSDATQPTVANSNFTAGEVTNNFFTVGLGTSGADAGAFKIFTSATTDVVIDLTGYYAPPNPSGLFYHPLPSPVRLVETRAGQSGCFQPAQLQGTNDPNADSNLDLQVQGRSPGLPSPCNSIPNDAVLLVGNATTVFPNAPLGAGYLTIYPSDATRPTVASSNYAGGDVINGPFSVKLGADGKFKIYTFSTTDLVVDISGYYSASPVDANGAGLLFSPLPKPMRLLETRADFPGFPLTGCYRTNAPIAGQPNVRTQPVWGTCSDQPITIPNTARAIAGNVTAINPVSAGFLTFFPGDVATAPTVATSNYPFPVTFGYNRHYFVGLGSADGNFKALTQFTTDLIVDVAGYFAP